MLLKTTIQKSILFNKNLYTFVDPRSGKNLRRTYLTWISIEDTLNLHQDFSSKKESCKISFRKVKSFNIDKFH